MDDFKTKLAKIVAPHPFKGSGRYCGLCQYEKGHERHAKAKPKTKRTLLNIVMEATEAHQAGKTKPDEYLAKLREIVKAG